MDIMEMNARILKLIDRSMLAVSDHRYEDAQALVGAIKALQRIRDARLTN